MIQKIFLVAFLAIAAPAAAHHAFGAEFDANLPKTLKGKVVKFVLSNPHSFIYMEYVNPDGAKEIWMVEGGSPNSLLRLGVDKNSLPIGTEIVVDGYQSRDHTLKVVNGRNVTFSDGRKLFLGSSAPEAANDGAEKATNKSR